MLTIWGNRQPFCDGISRRNFLRIGAFGAGLSLSGLLRARAASGSSSSKSAIMIYLPGGPPHQDMWDLKPDAPEGIRGEFKPIATTTPGIQICEHLPLLARRSRLWSLCRSLTHSSNDHSASHHIMLTGQSKVPPGFNASAPMPGDWPSLASVVGVVTPEMPSKTPIGLWPRRFRAGRAAFCRKSATRRNPVPVLSRY